MKRYAVVFEESAEETCVNHTIGVVAPGGSGKHNEGSPTPNRSFQTARWRAEGFHARPRGRRVLRRDPPNGHRPLSHAIHDKGS